MADPNQPDIVDINFLIGIAGIAAANQADSATIKKQLLDEVVTVLRSILTNHPDLIRVRLELARAFFIQGKDRLSKQHFDKVLVGNPPAPIVHNINKFLSIIKSRKRWQGYFSLNFEQNDNINRGHGTEVVYLLGLPFRLNNTRPRQELGVSIATGGEYSYPLSPQWHWQSRTDILHREFSGHQFDNTRISVGSGPKYLLSPNTELGLQYIIGQRWLAKKRINDDVGWLIKTESKINRHLKLSGNIYLRKNKYRKNLNLANLNKTERYYTLTSDYLFNSLTLGNVGLQFDNRTIYDNDQAKGTRFWFSIHRVMPYGWNLGSRIEWRFTKYRSNASLNNDRREDKNRLFSIFLLNRQFTVLGFSPQLRINRELQSSNSFQYNYQNTWINLRLIRQF